jgi:hypothetical protein
MGQFRPLSLLSGAPIWKGTLHFMMDVPLKDLENERNILLKEIEEHWRQRSRDIWIKSGDLNTKLFHNYVSYRRNCKFV